MTKPMRACENKKQIPQNKHAYPYTHTCNPTFHLHESHKKVLFVGFAGRYALSVLGIGLNGRRRGREGEIIFVHILLTSAWNKGREFREAASWRTQNLVKTEGTELFFFSRPVLKINARGGRETEKLGRFCKPNPVRFSERSASGFWPGRVKVHTNMCEPKVCSANRKLIFGFIFGSASSVAMRPGTFKKILAETLLLSRHKVTKWSWPRKNVFFTFNCLGLLCKAVRGGIDNQRGSSRTVLHEGE